MREGWKRFWDRFGYLCVLSACLAMVAVTAVWTRPIAEEPQAPEVTRYASPTPAPTPQPASVEVTIEPAQTQAPFVFPSAGQVGMPFAVQTLVYSETLREYRTHEGVDFLGEEGDPVRAAEDGTVYKTAAEVNGEKVAQCMLVVGTDGGGAQHPYWIDNLALAVRFQQELVSDYVSLARPIVLRNSSYNQQLSPGYLLVEVGGHGNTLTEAGDGARLFAQSVSQVLNTMWVK